jgi:hypothetical protein
VPLRVQQLKRKNAAPARLSLLHQSLPPGVTREMILAGRFRLQRKSLQELSRHRRRRRCVRAPSLTDKTWIHIDGSFDAIVKLVTTGFTKAETGRQAVSVFNESARGRQPY